MSTTWRTAEESRRDNQAAMGADLGDLYQALSDELSWIHIRWNQYRVLFGDKESRIDLLNEAAPLFFRIVQDDLFENTLLAIARMTERDWGPKRNLTISRLPKLIPDPALKAEVSVLINEAKSAAAFATDWRHRHLAHRSEDLALENSTAVPLQPASRQAVEVALAALRKVLNRIDEAYCQSTHAYRLVPSIGNGECLLRVIRDGLQVEAARRLRWEQGQLLPEDMAPSEEI